MTPVEVVRGDGPVVLGLPHTGTWLPEGVAARLNDRGRALADTDWHVDRLYDGLLPGATRVRATFHRYVIDANRDPGGASLYPGQNTTSLVPETDFDGAPIWDAPPDAAEVEARRRAYHAPYHAALQAELDRVRAAHGVAILWDCHSIRSQIPFLFEDTLPDLSIGTADGTTCAALLERNVQETCTAAEGYSSVLNGRFKGGWTTRHYGRPAEGLHAIQMELAQSAYLGAEAPPWTYDPARAERLRALLGALLASLVALAPTLKGTP
ncbi:MAG: N-formylglutamate deformylase [Shimia sp.]